MFDSFFLNQPKYLYDVRTTLSRSASALLDKGVSLQGGESAMTDGKSVIYLPQAMRSRLAWSEIDFVRYLVLHEMAHIEHSQDKNEVLRLLRRHPAAPWVINCLEDLRIEAVEQQQMVGYHSIISTGRRIACEMWKRSLKEMKTDQTMNVAISHAIYMCSVDSEFRKPTGVKALDAMVDLFDRNGVFDMISHVSDDVECFPTTESLVDFANHIIGLLPTRNDEQDNGEQEKMWGDRLHHDECRADAQNWADGAIEKCAKELESGLNDEGEYEDPVLGEGDLTGQSARHGIGSRTDSDWVRPKEGIKNYEWARHAVAQAGPLINALRGEARRGYSTPRDSGVRIAQKMVTPFLLGSTQNILRRRVKQPHNGTSVVFLVDDSGSMSSEGIHDLTIPAWRGAAMLAMACERAKIRNMIARYSDSTTIDKTFGEPLVKQRERMSKAYESGTDLGRALELAESYLQRETNPRRVLFVLCDGCTYDERPRIRKMRNSGIEVFPVLFGEYAMQESIDNRCWDLPGCIKIAKPNQCNLGAELVTRLVSVI
jgi:hypothetical protein